MISLRQVLDTHSPALLVDAASSRIQVAWLEHGKPAQWRQSDGEAGIAVFQCIEQLNISLAAAAAFVFCEGPGSILGIRTVAMALRSWNVLSTRPVFAYQSLAVVAQADGDPHLTVIADARRDTWHSFRIGGQLSRISAAMLEGRLAMPDHFRHWSPVPPSTIIVPYDLPELLRRTSDAELFRRADAPDAFLHEEPSYVTWTPQIHRAPAPS